MMPSRHLVSLSVLVVAAGLAAIAAPGAASAGPGATRYASPSGKGTACSSAHPCSIVTAINHAGRGQEVIVGPGTYGSQQHQIPTALSAEAPGLSIHGAVNKERPIIHLAAKIGLETAKSVALSNVQIDSSGSTSGLFALGTVSHVIVLSNGDGASACAVYDSIVDSLCVARGEDSTALAMTRGSEVPPTKHLNVTIRGVTAVATDPHGIGLLAAAGEFTAITVTATNDIFQGGLQDVESSTNASTATATVNLKHSDYHHSTASDAGGGEAAVNGNATDVSKPTRFAAPDQSNFREAPSSPTIDKGATDPAHDTDLVGRPRRVGSAPDIGAYEFLQRPAITHLKKRGVSADSATVSADVYAEGLRAQVRVVATHGHTVRESPWVTARNKLVARHVRLTVHGLAGHKKYAVRMVARNPGGTTSSAPISVTTR
ncbi:MAG TPA: choice-of-anchor Q domain-containing protein [Mycobacteriales bacterium]|jgi:hypothetical protein|nr:choice-of-anchor Q domain-containing protein [Mycobacteriales bacterium]